MKPQTRAKKQKGKRTPNPTSSDRAVRRIIHGQTEQLVNMAKLRDIRAMLRRVVKRSKAGRKIPAVRLDIGLDMLMMSILGAVKAPQNLRESMAVLAGMDLLRALPLQLPSVFSKGRKSSKKKKP